MFKPADCSASDRLGRNYLPKCPMLPEKKTKNLHLIKFFSKWKRAIWISQWLKFFLAISFFPFFFFFFFFFRFQPSSGGSGVSKLDLKCKLWMRPFSIKTRILQKKKFKTFFLSTRVLPLVKMLAKLDHIWGSKDPKSSQKNPFHECWIGKQNFENF